MSPFALWVSFMEPHSPFNFQSRIAQISAPNVLPSLKWGGGCRANPPHLPQPIAEGQARHHRFVLHVRPIPGQEHWRSARRASQAQS